MERGRMVWCDFVWSTWGLCFEVKGSWTCKSQALNAPNNQIGLYISSNPQLTTISGFQVSSSPTPKMHAWPTCRSPSWRYLHLLFACAPESNLLWQYTMRALHLEMHPIQSLHIFPMESLVVDCLVLAAHAMKEYLFTKKQVLRSYSAGIVEGLCTDFVKSSSGFHHWFPGRRLHIGSSQIEYSASSLRSSSSYSVAPCDQLHKNVLTCAWGHLQCITSSRICLLALEVGTPCSCHLRPFGSRDSQSNVTWIIDFFFELSTLW